MEEEGRTMQGLTAWEEAAAMRNDEEWRRVCD